MKIAREENEGRLGKEGGGEGKKPQMKM